jgi:hypothetical protein
MTKKTIKEKKESSKPILNSYQRMIEAFVQAEVENREYTWQIKKKTKYIDSYQIYMDHYEHRLIVSIYYGSKNPKRADDNSEDEEESLDDNTSEEEGEEENEIVTAK